MGEEFNVAGVAVVSTVTVSISHRPAVARSSTATAERRAGYMEGKKCIQIYNQVLFLICCHSYTPLLV